MARFHDWFHKHGQTSRVRLADPVRRAIGYLQNQLRLGGLTSGRYRTRAPDGTPIDVSIVDGIVVARGGETPTEDCITGACEIELFNGLFDLGTPSNPTAHKRFKLFPNSSETQTVYKGDTSSCTSVRPSTKLRITEERCPDGRRSLRVAAVCPEDEPAEAEQDAIQGSGAEVVAKKRLQDKLPASFFTGLLRHWVQALYGNPEAAYEALPQGLEVPSTDPGTPMPLHWWTYADAAHVVMLGANLYLCRLNNRITGEFAFHRIQLTPCGARAFEFIQRFDQLREGRALTEEERQRWTVLGVYMFVGAVPVIEPTWTAVLNPLVTNPESTNYCHIAWNSNGRHGVTVRNDGTNLQLWQVDLALNEDGVPEFTATLTDSDAYPGEAGFFFKHLVYDEDYNAGPTAPQIIPVRWEGTSGPKADAAYNVPVQAFYDAEDRRVVAWFQYSVASGEAGVDDSECAGPSTDFECESDPSCTAQAKADTHFVTSGFVVKREGTTIYSSVAVTECWESGGDLSTISSHGAQEAKNATSVDDGPDTLTATPTSTGPTNGGNLLADAECLARTSPCVPNRSNTVPACTLTYFTGGSDGVWDLDEGADPCPAYNDACWNYTAGSCITALGQFDLSCIELEVDITRRVWSWDSHSRAEYRTSATRSVLVSPLGDAAGFVVRSVTGQYVTLEDGTASRESPLGYEAEITTNSIAAVAPWVPGDLLCAYTRVGTEEDCGSAPGVVPTWATAYSCDYSSVDSKPLSQPITTTASCAYELQSLSEHTFAAALFNTHHAPLMVQEATGGPYSEESGTECGASVACYIGATSAPTGSGAIVQSDDFAGPPSLGNALVIYEGEATDAWPQINGTNGVVRLRTSAGGACVYHASFKERFSSERMELEDVDSGYPEVQSPSWIGAS